MLALCLACPGSHAKANLCNAPPLVSVRRRTVIDTPREPPSRLSRRLSQPGGTRVLSVRGVETVVDLQGNGPALLLVHGFPLDRTMWRPLSSVLIGRLRIAPDLRVVSDRLDDSGAAGMGVLADDLAALLDALEVERAVVCGHSMGGYVAFEMLRRHSDRLSGLILCHTRAAADSAEAREARDELAGLVRDLGTPSVVERMLPKLLAPSSLETLPQVVEHVEAMIGRNHTDGIIAALSAMKHRADSTGLLPTIGKQTLVVAGAQDQLIPVAQSRTMAAAIPGAQFTVIPEAGHLAPLEQPVATSLVIGGFLESLH